MLKQKMVQLIRRQKHLPSTQKSTINYWSKTLLLRNDERRPTRGNRRRLWREELLLMHRKKWVHNNKDGQLSRVGIDEEKRQAGRHACMREGEEANENSTVSTHPPPYTCHFLLKNEEETGRRESLQLYRHARPFINP